MQMHTKPMILIPLKPSANHQLPRPLSIFACQDDGPYKLIIRSVVSGAIALLLSPFFLPSIANNWDSPAKMADLNVSHNGACITVTDNQSALIFLGTGCSSAVPNAMCLIQPSNPPCRICSQALSVPPEENPNYRCFRWVLLSLLQLMACVSRLSIGIVDCIDCSFSASFNWLLLNVGLEKWSLILAYLFVDWLLIIIMILDLELLF